MFMPFTIFASIYLRKKKKHYRQDLELVQIVKVPFTEVGGPWNFLKNLCKMHDNV